MYCSLDILLTILCFWFFFKHPNNANFGDYRKNQKNSGKNTTSWKKLKLKQWYSEHCGRSFYPSKYIIIQVKTIAGLQIFNLWAPSFLSICFSKNMKMLRGFAIIQDFTAHWAIKNEKMATIWKFDSKPKSYIHFFEEIPEKKETRE